MAYASELLPGEPMMQTRPSTRRPTRVPVSLRDEGASEEPPVESEVALDDISASLELASSYREQAMTSTDWEIVDRNIVRARELVGQVQRELSHRTLSRGQAQRMKAQCTALRGEIDRAQALLHMSLVKLSSPTRS